MAFGIGDFFGSIFTKKILGKGVEMAFGGGDSAQGPAGYSGPSYQPFRTTSLDMPMYSSTPAGETQNIEMADMMLINSVWDKRLFGDNSYTNITLPRLDT